MSILTRSRRQSKPVSQPRPSAPFGAGLLDNPALEPRVDLLELTAEEREMLYGPLESIPIDDDEPGPCSRLPRIDGHGLSMAEWTRMNGARNRSRAAYAVSVPDADAIELDRVATAAARDELRRLLRDRPPAVAVAIDPGDVESDPADWPAWTDDDVWVLGPEDQGGNDEPDEPPAARSRPFEAPASDRAWWAAHCPSAQRQRVPAPHRDRDMRRIGAVG